MIQKMPTWKDIKSVLAEMNSMQLCGILQDLYKFNNENKAFFHSRFLSNQAGNDYLDSYKLRIKKATYPKEPWKQDVKLSAGRKVISEFKKANRNIKDTISLMVYYIKCGNDLTLEFGDIDEAFYNSMATMFHTIISTLIRQKDELLASEFIPLLEVEVERVKWMGWGYADELRDLFNDLLDVFSVKIKADT